MGIVIKVEARMISLDCGRLVARCFEPPVLGAHVSEVARAIWWVFGRSDLVRVGERRVAVSHHVGW